VYRIFIVKGFCKIKIHLQKPLNGLDLYFIKFKLSLKINLNYSIYSMKKLRWTLVLLLPFAIHAQSTISFSDLSFWKNTGKSNWQIASDAKADLNKPEVLSIQSGTGILVNLPNK